MRSIQGAFTGLVAMLALVATGCGGSGGGRAPFTGSTAAPITTAPPSAPPATTPPTPPPPPVTPPATPAVTWRVSGWLPYWAYTAGDRTLDANVGDGLDEVNLFGYRLKSDGSIAATTGAESAARHAAIRGKGGELIPTILDVDDAAAMAAVLGSAAARQRFVVAVGDVLDRFGYDGIDIDFEHVTAATRDTFSQLMADMAVAVKARGKVVSITVPGKRADRSNWPGYDYAALGRVADRVKLMTYGYSGPWTRTPGPIAPLSWIRQVMDYAVTTMPASKLVIGIPFYGYDWPNNTTGTISSVTWSSAQARLARSAAGLQFDAVKGEAHFAYTDAAGVAHTVWLQDARAIAAKAQLVKDYGAHGLAIWALGNEDPAFWDSIRAVLKP